MEQQDPAYNHLGVPLDSEVYKFYADTFEDPIKTSGSISTVQCKVDAMH